MYIPLWLILIGVIFFIIYKRENKSDTIENIEERVGIFKKRIFEKEHFDSQHFIDLQNTFEVMEVNYLRLKQRFIHTHDKTLEISKDWERYVKALGDLKLVRVMLDVDGEDNAFDRATENSKEPSIIKDEIEKRFKSLLGEDWQNISPDYLERIEMERTKREKEGHEIKKTQNIQTKANWDEQ